MTTLAQGRPRATATQLSHRFGCQVLEWRKLPTLIFVDAMDGRECWRKVGESHHKDTQYERVE